jgi:opacity protein-like surface antigen
MKKLSACLICLIFLLPAAGQMNDIDKKFNLGIIAIPNLSWSKPDTKNLQEGAGVRPAISMGLSGDFNFSRNYSFTVEVLHSNTGFKLKADSLYNNGQKHANVVINYSISAFQIPLSLKLRTNEIGYVKYYGQIGLAPGFSYKSIKADYAPNTVFSNPDDGTDRLVNENGYDFPVNENEVNPENRRYYLTSDNVRSISLPVFVGGGVEYNISGNTSLVGGIRYEYGIMNVLKAGDATAQRSSFGLVLGVKF